ncbi:hypothetical protein NX059_011976 [Plenodomus lindquistii]|nr:hypothetical protein NX059_011976 [Plenodomus lindquistii]
MASLLFQIHSDLHLETPLLKPSYTHFTSASTFPLQAPNLFLLGDIGLIKHPQLFVFLRTLLLQRSDLRIFYILGNHEVYGMNMDVAVAKLEQFERDCNFERKRFFLLNRRRVDIDDRVTVLGCTLWTQIPAEAAQAVGSRVMDFCKTNGIWGRSVEEHNADHARDLAWLNAQVENIATNEPQREIVILTHHSPTVDVRANDQRHAKSEMAAGFCTDLSREVCWRSERVKMWAFGHTHFSCQYVDDGECGREVRKLVIANQKGYASVLANRGWEVEPVVVAAGEWRVVVGAMEEWRICVGREDHV